MWDVVWTDPDRELVAQRRAKKCECTQKEFTRESLSSVSSKSSSTTSTLGRLLRARPLRRGSSPSKHMESANMPDPNGHGHTAIESVDQHGDGASASASLLETLHGPTSGKKLEQTFGECYFPCRLVFFINPLLCAAL